MRHPLEVRARGKERNKETEAGASVCRAEERGDREVHRKLHTREGKATASQHEEMERLPRPALAGLGGGGFGAGSEKHRGCAVKRRW